MKPAPFAYHRATSIDDAIAHLSAGDALVRALAGGQSLVPMLNLRLAPVDKLVDLEDRRVPDGSNGLMPFVGSQIAYRAVRTRGTIGGAIALADPAADWLTTIIALEARIALAGPGGRRVLSGTDFAVGPYMTALSDAELIEAIEVPRRPGSERWGHYKMARKTGEYAESMAVALIDKTLGKARLVVGATDGAPLVLVNSSRAIVEGNRGDTLAALIRVELAASGRDFSPSKILLHSTVALRAVQNAGKP
jgi:carbon-monoxide dehydrogenase medium subunit